MVSILQRMRTLRGKLATLRHGPGAAILPPNVQKIELFFPEKNKGGHMGPRKFWRLYLPRLKYYNPNLDVQVERPKGADPNAASTVTVHFSDKPPTIIDAKNRQGLDLCAKVMEVTNATTIPSNPDDVRQVAEYQVLVKQNEASDMAKAARRRAKREEKEKERLGVM